MKPIEIESFYKSRGSKKKLLSYELIDDALLGIRIVDGEKIKGSIVLEKDKLKKLIK